MARKRVITESDDDESLGEAPSPQSASRLAELPSPPKRARQTSSRSQSKRTVIESDEEDATPATAAVEEEDVKPAIQPSPTRQETPAPTTASAAVPSIAVQASSPGARPPASQRSRIHNSSDDENVEPQAGPSQPRRAPSAAPSSQRATMTPSRRQSTYTAVRAQSSIVSEPEKPKAPVQRLVIHRIVLINFKSYAGRQEIGPFHKSFSAIVGPNGSGKSNTIDALLFVFGFRASKMRQGKVSELIHNSEDYNPDFCTVEIHFREIIDKDGDPDGYDVIPGSQLVVARTGYKSNSSKYTINGRTCQMPEVTTLLKGKGIDLDHNRFLILQGEVESIAQMKPKAPTAHEDGLLEYLEDIIGTTELKAPIEAAVVELDKLTEEKSEKVARIKIVEREKQALEPRKKEADDYLHDQNELILRNSELWQLYAHHCTNTLESARQNVAQATADLEKEEKDQAGNKAQLAEAQQVYDEVDREVKQFEKATVEIERELAVYDRNDAQLSERRKHAESQHKKLETSIKTDSHARNKASSDLKNATLAVNKHRTEVEGFEKQLAKADADLERITESLKGKTDHIQAQLEVKQRELQPWQAKIEQKRADIRVASSERELLADKAKSAQQALEEAEIALDRARGDQESRASEIRDFTAERESIESAMIQAKKSLEAAQAQGETRRSKALAARAKHEEARANQSASKSKSAVLQSLTKLREMGRLEGFHGRLGNLGRIDDQYDVAISTAAPSLDNLICDTVETGQACLDHLRRNRAGRATIMCLNSLTVRAGDYRPIDTPEGVPRLFDLVTPKDPIYAPAFYQVLRDTLVAKDLDQANRLAYGGNKRWRVVTLTGQLIDTSGTMSGGGQRKLSGAMSSKIQSDADSSPEVIARLERERVEAEEELENFQVEKDAAEKEYTRIKRRIPELETELEKAKMRARQDARRVEDAEERVKELKAQVKPSSDDVKKMADLAKTINKLEAELEDLQTSAREIEAEIKQLKDQIMQIGGIQLKIAMTAVRDLKEQIDTANEMLNKNEVTRAKAEKDETKLSRALEKNEVALVDLADEVEKLNKELRENTTAAKGIREQVESLRATLETKKEELAEDKALLEAKKAEMHKFGARMVKLQQLLESEKKTLKDSEAKLQVWQGKLATLELHELDDSSDDEDEVAPAPAPAAPIDDAAAMDEDGEPAPAAQPAPAARRRREPVELRQYSAEELDDFDPDELKAQVAILEDRINKSRPNLSVLKEYSKRQKEYAARTADLEAVNERREAAKAEHDRLRKERLDKFLVGFHQISLKLKEMYQMITLGGNAELELVDSLDPFSEGIIFSVMPPKKSWKQIANLSGGEKTLSSLALVFALHVYKPTPLYFMDEIDAALDFRNVSMCVSERCAAEPFSIGNYIQARCKGGQFIIISLRNNMFELAARLVGIYKVKNKTRTIAIDNNDLHRMALPPTATTKPATPGPPRGPSATPRPSVAPRSINGHRPSVSVTPRAQSTSNGVGSAAPI